MFWDPFVGCHKTLVSEINGTKYGAPGCLATLFPVMPGREARHFSSVIIRTTRARVAATHRPSRMNFVFYRRGVVMIQPTLSKEGVNRIADVFDQEEAVPAMRRVLEQPCPNARVGSTDVSDDAVRRIRKQVDSRPSFAGMGPHCPFAERPPACHSILREHLDYRDGPYRGNCA